MNLEQRILLLSQLGAYIDKNAEAWQAAKNKTTHENGWFVPEFVDLACKNISLHFLQEQTLRAFASRYNIADEQAASKTVGIVMAGNIPLVGFHDFLCGFLSGHALLLKPSSKDEVLIKHLVEKMQEWEPSLAEHIRFAAQLKGCDAYIATGSNNSGRYFDYYFRNYPSIIRKNRTSVAVLTGNETTEQLGLLADDLMLYFGLGCRNVSKLYVPVGYNFQPLLKALDSYNWMADHHKYKNNYDYHLAIHLLNSKYYMTNGVVLLIESQQLFSPISQVNYEYYTTLDTKELLMQHADELQCISGSTATGFGHAQAPGIADFADGVDTMQFLTSF